MDSDFRVDLDEIMNNLNTAQVVAIYFPILGKTLLLDRRIDPVEGPLVKVVPMAGSVEERFRSLRRLRPGLPIPKSIAIIPWPKYVASLRRLGIWDRIVERFCKDKQPQAVEACQGAYEEISRLEREELRDAIAGKRFHSLWERGA